ncbi:MAG: HAMP domain-containing sensor histidine kinase, partial [Pseudomonadota bacterium]
EIVALEELLSAARRMGAAAVEGTRIAFDVTNSSSGPPLYVDRLQIEVVLRNLIANAVESITASGTQGGSIRVLVEDLDGAQLRFVVADTGPGPSASGRERIFEPFVSGKSTGMGLGLAVSRAIAEAHGGSLEAAPVAHGEFHLILPCVQSA